MSKYKTSELRHLEGTSEREFQFFRAGFIKEQRCYKIQDAVSHIFFVFVGNYMGPVCDQNGREVPSEGVRFKTF